MSGSRRKYRTRAVGGGDVVVEDAASGRVVGCYRTTGEAAGRGTCRAYVARFDDPEARARFEGPALEIGRFCVEAGPGDPDVLRVAWGVLSGHVDRRGIEVLSGCATLAGSDAAPYREAFALLRARHAVSEPAREAPKAVAFARRLSWPDIDAVVRWLPRMRRNA